MATARQKQLHGGRRWENLNHDLLVAIIRRLGVADLIAGVRLVCSSWHAAARDPLCWLELDFRDWDSIAIRTGGLSDRGAFFRLLLFSVTCADGLINSVHFPYVAAELDLLNVAAMCPRLEYFSWPNPVMDESTFCEAISKLKFLRGMAVDEDLIYTKLLQHVNQCCIHFRELRVIAPCINECMASAICKSLPSLRKLEITESVIQSRTIIMFLDELKELEHFDISGYENSAITNAVLQKASHLKVFLWTSRFDLGEFRDCSNCGEETSPENGCECMLQEEMMKWLTEIS
ncbi:F-box/LRR-repeat protein [Canna indica]|uniref:F-box/LRR-repeat protein n=1 Tax=Canna indica TaxID=4628 RepID=A0AAQ3K615_9LILI|nr:F-box/LRR-repeat protein [Canna indica]